MERWMILESTLLTYLFWVNIPMVVRGRVVRGRKECTFSNNFELKLYENFLAPSWSPETAKLKTKHFPRMS